MMLNLLHCTNSISWIIPAGVMLGSAPSYFVVWGLWRLLSLPFPRRVYERGDEFLYWLYQQLVLFFFENCSGLKVILYGDVEDIFKQKENVIFISNHQCTVDWMVADMLAIRQGTLGNIRYILKDGLKYMPLYGFYFRQHSCVYVKRAGQFNEEKARHHLDTIVKNKTPFWMVLFPEGTRFNPLLTSTIERSRDYAKQNGFKVMQHVLTPRVRAFQLCLEHLLPNTDAIYDVTIAYSNTMSSTGVRLTAPSLSDILQRRCRSVHVYIERIPTSKVPSDTAQVQRWLTDRFERKDQLLHRFYTDQTACNTLGSRGRVSTLSLKKTLPSLIFWLGMATPLLLAERGCSVYWKVTVAGTVFGWIVMYFST